jgi:hypothetical protein
MFNPETIEEMKKVIKSLESNLWLINYGDIAFQIAIIAKLEDINPNITFKEFYSYLLNNSSRIISIKTIEVDSNEPNSNGNPRGSIPENKG